MSRRIYPVNLVINGRILVRVIIDPHYEKRHKDSIDDQLILRLIDLLDGWSFEPATHTPPYRYFVVDGLRVNRRTYKIVWLLEDDEDYVGVINAYRRD